MQNKKDEVSKMSLEESLMCCVCENSPNDEIDAYTFYRGSFMCENCLNDWLEYASTHRYKGQTDLVFAQWIKGQREILRKERGE